VAHDRLRQAENTMPAPRIVRTGIDAATFAMQRADGGTNGQTVTDVPGLGDEAFSVMGGRGGEFNEVAARRGSVEVVVTATAPVGAEEQLIRLILASIR
jgi:hypothetical protein